MEIVVILQLEKVTYNILKLKLFKRAGCRQGK